jgi:hypothetical protein
VAPRATGSGCPACRSADVERVPRLKLLGVIALVAYGVGAAVGQAALALAAVIAVALIIATMPSHRYPACEERWSPEEPVDMDPEAPPPDPADTPWSVAPLWIAGARSCFVSASLSAPSARIPSGRAHRSALARSAQVEMWLLRSTAMAAAARRRMTRSNGRTDLEG